MMNTDSFYQVCNIKYDNELNLQEEVGVLSDSIYDKLLGLMGVSKSRSKTRKTKTTVGKLGTC